MCKASTLAKHRTLPYWRPLVPAAMVAGTVTVVVGGLAHARPLLALSPLLAYAAGAGVVAARLSRDPGVAPHRSCLALAICHWSYGLGFWRGISWALRAEALPEPPAGAPLMPGSRIARLTETATKAVELALRTVGRGARAAGGPAPGRRRAAARPGRSTGPVRDAAGLGRPRPVRGRHRPGPAPRGAPTCASSTCGGGLEICDRANTYEAPPMPCTTCDRYVRTSIEAHGFPRTSMRALWEAEADDPGDWPELDAMSAAELEHVDGRRPRPGQPRRQARCGGSCSPPTSRTTRSGRGCAGASCGPAGASCARVERALDEHQPDVVVVLNGLFLFESITWALCQARGIDVVTYERAFRKETLVFSRRAPAGFYDFSEAWADSFRDLTEEEGAEIDEYLALRRSGQAFDQHWGPGRRPAVAKGPGRLVSLFTNVTWDTAVLGRHCAFADIQAWVDAAIQAFRERPAHRLVIRVHPSEIHLPGTGVAGLARGLHRPRPPGPPAERPGDRPVRPRQLVPADGGQRRGARVHLDDRAGAGGVRRADDRGGGHPLPGQGLHDRRRQPGGVHRARSTPRWPIPAPLRPDVATARRYAHFFFFRAPLPAPGVVEPLPGLARVTVRRPRGAGPGPQRVPRSDLRRDPPGRALRDRDGLTALRTPTAVRAGSPTTGRGRCRGRRRRWPGGARGPPRCRASSTRRPASTPELRLASVNRSGWR